MDKYIQDIAQTFTAKCRQVLLNLIIAVKKQEAIFKGKIDRGKISLNFLKKLCIKGALSRFQFIFRRGV